MKKSEDKDQDVGSKGWKVCIKKVIRVVSSPKKARNDLDEKQVESFTKEEENKNNLTKIDLNSLGHSTFSEAPVQEVNPTLHEKESNSTNANFHESKISDISEKMSEIISEINNFDLKFQETRKNRNSAFDKHYTLDKFSDNSVGNVLVTDKSLILNGILEKMNNSESLFENSICSNIKTQNEELNESNCHEVEIDLKSLEENFENEKFHHSRRESIFESPRHIEIPIMPMYFGPEALEFIL